MPGNTVSQELAKQDSLRRAIECYEGQVVRVKYPMKPWTLTRISTSRMPSTLMDVPWDLLSLIEVARATDCEGRETDREVLIALKQVSCNKSSMFILFLTDVFNHWFDEGSIPGQVTKGVIILLRMRNRHSREELDDYRPITLVNREYRFKTMSSPRSISYDSFSGKLLKRTDSQQKLLLVKEELGSRRLSQFLRMKLLMGEDLL